MKRLAAGPVNVLVCLLALLLGCSQSSPSVTEDSPSPAARAAVERLLHRMRQRLLIMHDVARWKWNGQRPVADPEREQLFLDTIVARTESGKLDAEFTRAFFVAQIQAAKQLQEDDFRRWTADAPGQFPDVPDLAAQIRPKIDALSGDLLAALAVVQPLLGNRAVRDHVRRRAADVLTSDGITETIREIASQPLLTPRP